MNVTNVISDISLMLASSETLEGFRAKWFAYLERLIEAKIIEGAVIH